MQLDDPLWRTLWISGGILASALMGLWLVAPYLDRGARAIYLVALIVIGIVPFRAMARLDERDHAAARRALGRTWFRLVYVVKYTAVAVGLIGVLLIDLFDGISDASARTASLAIAAIVVAMQLVVWRANRIGRRGHAEDEERGVTDSL